MANVANVASVPETVFRMQYICHTFANSMRVRRRLFGAAARTNMLAVSSSLFVSLFFLIMGYSGG